MIRARDLDDALAIANGTHYALTGGLYSRSPANIERVKRALRVGNVYINRPITGALVDRQPFGGFKLSGIGGSKAGGSDYLGRVPPHPGRHREHPPARLRPRGRRRAGRGGRRRERTERSRRIARRRSSRLPALGPSGSRSARRTGPGSGDSIAS